MSYYVELVTDEDFEQRTKTTKRVLFREGEHGDWEVQMESDGEWERFADGGLEPVDVRQLLRKEYDVRY